LVTTWRSESWRSRRKGAKIGIRAPRETVVLRKELKITQQQNEAAAYGLTENEFQQALEKLRGNSKIDPSLR
jgi:sRNA-binding carbon storage regulator CsrA